MGVTNQDKLAGRFFGLCSDRLAVGFVSRRREGGRVAGHRRTSQSVAWGSDSIQGVVECSDLETQLLNRVNEPNYRCGRDQNTNLSPSWTLRCVDANKLRLG